MVTGPQHSSQDATPPADMDGFARWLLSEGITAEKVEKWAHDSDPPDRDYLDVAAAMREQQAGGDPT
jgi:hypothetical protein